MSADLLIQQLSFIAPLSAPLQSHFQHVVREEKHPKKHLLLKEGQVAQKIYLIKKGFARAFYFTKDGKECTSWFLSEGDIMISVFSFYTQHPAAENIELLEDSVLLSMSWQAVQATYAGYPEFNFHGRQITEKYYLQSEERNILLRTLSARERYERLINTHPNILQKATLGQIASFLGISPETLSRVRNTL